MSKKILIESIGAMILLVLMSFNSVAASNVHQQITAEKNKLLREYFYKLHSADPRFDSISILDILFFLFSVVMSLSAWFYINFWSKIDGLNDSEWFPGLYLLVIILFFYFITENYIKSGPPSL